MDKSASSIAHHLDHFVKTWHDREVLHMVMMSPALRSWPPQPVLICLFYATGFDQGRRWHNGSPVLIRAKVLWDWASRIWLRLKRQGQKNIYIYILSVWIFSRLLVQYMLLIAIETDWCGYGESVMKRTTGSYKGLMVPRCSLPSVAGLAPAN